MIALALKIALVLTVSGLLVFTADYTRMTRGACWKDPVGQTIIIAEILALGGFTPLLLAVFLRFSSLASEIASWVLIVFWGVGGLAMFWRTWVFERIYRRGKKIPPDSAPLKEGFTVIETKVKASTAAAAVSGIVLWILGRYVFNGNVPDVIASWVYALVPAVVAGAAGYLAPHTPRPVTPAAPAAPPAGPVA